MMRTAELQSDTSTTLLAEKDGSHLGFQSSGRQANWATLFGHGRHVLLNPAIIRPMF